MKVKPDDELYRVRTVWLGPTGMTMPWTARYLAYGVWLMTFMAVLLAEAITPLTVHLPPVWEIAGATLFTYGVMTFVDHERPIGSIWRTFLADLSAPRRAKFVKHTLSVRATRKKVSIMKGLI